jgi:hypothetical protein
MIDYLKMQKQLYPKDGWTREDPGRVGPPHPLVCRKRPLNRNP